MGKRLNTTVHIGDTETGASRVVGPDDKLTDEDVKELQDRWGKRFDDFVVDADDDEDEDPGMNAESQREALEVGGRALADSQPAGATPKIEEAMEIHEEARTDANPAGVEDSGGKRSNRSR